MKQKQILKVIVCVIVAMFLLSATVFATPSRTLKRDCSGSDVKELQTQLVKVGYLKQQYATGYYGQITEAAVKSFQKANGITADGIAGTQTYAKLFTSSSTSTAKLDTSKTYKLDDQSNGVKLLQQMLISKGYLASGKDTGYFGSLTQDAVKKFQKSKGLTADGVAGPQTLLKLSTSTSTSSTSSVSSSSSTVATYVAKPGTLRLGDKGADVTKLQQALAKKNLFSGAATGIFDSKTKTALLKFQKANGLVADGIAGARTFSKLYNTTSTAVTVSASTFTSANMDSINSAAATFTQDQKDEVYLLAQIITAEARGQCYEGQVAVGSVVMNRVSSSGSDVHSVIYAHNGTSYQFAPAKNGAINVAPTTSAYNAAVEAYMGAKPVANSLYFCDPVASPTCWQMLNRPLYRIIGSHAFFL